MTLHCGDCLEVMRGMDANSVDLVLTDPPYGLAFMGKRWDYDVPSIEIWAEALRVLKPGGHLLAFAGTRTQHRMACRIEDAGFEIRDMLAWVYGSGFPKSLDVSKAIDKAAGAEREKVKVDASKCRNPKAIGAGRDGMEGGTRPWIVEALKVGFHEKEGDIPATDAAREWDGWGTALKPALEPITMARKPLIGTVAANVLEHGTGALNIDACRVGTENIVTLGSPKKGTNSYGDFAGMEPTSHTGRWPANLIHDGSEEATKPLRSAARFFYTAKACMAERDMGCEGMEARFAPTMGNGIGGKEHDPDTATPKANHHPTVKPVALMKYLTKLASRPGAVVLDPFMGSGTTGIACKILGREFIGIERDSEYFKLAEARIASHVQTELAI